MSIFIRKVKTKSGATAVQIVHKSGRQVTSIKHIGSAHTQEQLTLLLEVAKQQLLAGQLSLFTHHLGKPSVLALGSASAFLFQTLHSSPLP